MQTPSIPQLLVANLPRELVLAVGDALDVGAQRAYPAARGMDEGHLTSVLGQMRHFHMNETFVEALTLANAEPTPLRGNRVVVGRSGLFRLARFNISEGPWYNARRSQTRRAMALANEAIEGLVHPDLFEPTKPILTGTMFFVSVFSGSIKNSPERPLSIHIAVPDREMRNWLFREPISEFLCRYNDVAVESQQDLAVPVLKTNVVKPAKGLEE